MIDTITKVHFAVHKKSYDFKASKSNAVDYVDIAPTYENFKYNMQRVGSPWDWPLMQGRFSEEAMTPLLQDPETKLRVFTLDDEAVGYALIVGVRPSLSDKFWSASHNQKIVEIMTIGLYPEECGHGKGWAFFEQQFEDLFAEYDTVYWSSSSTNHPHLPAFYERMGAEILLREPVPDPRVGLEVGRQQRVAEARSPKVA